MPINSASVTVKRKDIDSFLRKYKETLAMLSNGFSTKRRCKMLFKEAMENMINGKFMARACWAGTGEYIVIMPGMNTIWKILIQPNPNAGNWLPLIADLLADDWQIMENARAVSAPDQATSTPEAPVSA